MTNLRKTDNCCINCVFCKSYEISYMDKCKCNKNILPENTRGFYVCDEWEREDKGFHYDDPGPRGTKGIFLTVASLGTPPFMPEESILPYICSQE